MGFWLVCLFPNESITKNSMKQITPHIYINKSSMPVNEKKEQWGLHLLLLWNCLQTVRQSFGQQLGAYCHCRVSLSYNSTVAPNLSPVHTQGTCHWSVVVLVTQDGVYATAWVRTARQLLAQLSLCEVIQSHCAVQVLFHSVAALTQEELIVVEIIQVNSAVKK